MKGILFFAVYIFMYTTLVAQTFTMGKECREKDGQAIGMLKEKKYPEALEAYQLMAKSCKTKDAKETIAVGKAEAYNGMGKYEDAINASDAALKVTKNKSLKGLFQKAVAQARLKQNDAAKATFARMISLTEKNQDTKARASNYAIMSAFYWRQLNQKDSAVYYLDKAIGLDPSNTDFIIQRGDMFVDEKKYDDAFVQYDKAVSMGKSDIEMYTIRSDARLKMVQQKYGTNNAQELRSKMTAGEKDQVCTELNRAISLGLKDMQKDMFASLVCK